MESLTHEAVPPTLRQWLRTVSADTREEGIEILALVYIADGKLQAACNPFLTDAEQSIITARVLPAVLDAQREILELNEKKSRRVV